jgi:MYXO-CTERM domain-containing protein
MKRIFAVPFALIVCLAFVPAARANPWSFELFEVAFNQNGSMWDWPYSNAVWTSMPSNVDRTGFDAASGTGSLKVKILATGAYDFGVLFDHEIKDATGVAFYANNGEALGAPPAGMSWEIDEPEIGGWNYTGDIFTNLVNVTLDNQPFFNGSDTWTDPEDVAMALGFQLNIPQKHHAVVTLTVSTQDPGSGFRLHQWAVNGQQETAHLYLRGSAAYINDEGGPPPVPEPWQAPLVAAALAALGVLRRGRTGRQ